MPRADTSPADRKPGHIRSVCVYCGASGGVDATHVDAARTAGRTLARNGLELVYGGGRVGLMGVVADAALAAGGSVTGIIPHFLDEMEIAHTGVTTLIRTDTMHTRKAEMARRADAFWILPGGFGTLDECFEILTWKQLGLHDKPVVFLNVGGYWDALLNTLRGMVDARFARAEHLGLFATAETVESALEAARACPPPRHDVRDKWL